MLVRDWAWENSRKKIPIFIFEIYCKPTHISHHATASDSQIWHQNVTCSLANHRAVHFECIQFVSGIEFFTECMTDVVEEDLYSVLRQYVPCCSWTKATCSPTKFSHGKLIFIVSSRAWPNAVNFSCSRAKWWETFTVVFCLLREEEASIKMIPTPDLGLVVTVLNYHISVIEKVCSEIN